MERGLLIVFEGLDKSYKTTYSTLLFSKLQKLNIKVKYYKFPSNSDVGKEIRNKINKQITENDIESLHKLFVKDRKDFMDSISNDLKDGYICILDRYFFSGIVYSLSLNIKFKLCDENIDLNNAFQKFNYLTLDKNNILPDIIFFMDRSITNIENDENFGNDLLEEINLQKIIRKKYKLFENWLIWEIINVSNNDKDNILDIIYKKIKELNIPIKPIIRLFDPYKNY